MIVLMDESNSYLAEGIDPMPGAVRYIVYVGKKAVGVGDVRENMAVAEPHITWFKEATLREMCIAFLEGIRFFAKEKPVVLSVTKENYDFYDQWVRRGLLRKIGKVIDIEFGDIEEIHMYQVNRSKL